MIDVIVSSPPALAAVCTAFGGVLLKLLEWFLSRNHRKNDTRKEFREEWKELLDRVDKLEEEIDEWRGKYYRGQEEILTLKAMIIGAGIKVPDDIRGLEQKPE